MDCRDEPGNDGGGGWGVFLPRPWGEVAQRRVGSLAVTEVEVERFQFALCAGRFCFSLLHVNFLLAD